MKFIFFSPDHQQKHRQTNIRIEPELYKSKKIPKMEFWNDETEN